MKASFPPSRTTEQTAWILIAVLLGLVLLFCYLFHQRISRDLPEGIRPAAQVFVRV